MAALCMLIALHPLGQALRISTLRASLSGKAMQVITTRRLVELNGNEEQALLGAGFE
jgi:conjugal transfer pilus assembly protein TraD